MVRAGTVTEWLKFSIYMTNGRGMTGLYFQIKQVNSSLTPFTERVPMNSHFPEIILSDNPSDPFGVDGHNTWAPTGMFDRPSRDCN